MAALSLVAIRWILAALLACAFSWLAVFNWSVPVRYLLRRRVGRSWIPLVGGVLGVAAIVIAPLEGVRRYFWIPFVLDFGCVPGLFHALFVAIRREARRRENRRTFVKLLIHGKSEAQGFYQVLHIEAPDVDCAVAAAREYTQADDLEMDGLKQEHTEVRTFVEIPEGMLLAWPARMSSGTVVARTGRIWHPFEDGTDGDEDEDDDEDDA